MKSKLVSASLFAICFALSPAMAQSTVGGGTPGQSQTGNDPANSGTHMGDPDVAPATNGTTGTGTNNDATGTSRHRHHHHASGTPSNSGQSVGNGSGGTDNTGGANTPH